MLKKAGLVVATVTVGMIAVSPLAFAGDKSHDAHRTHDNDRSSYKSVEDNDTYSYQDDSVNRDQHNRCAFIQNEESTFSGPLGGPLTGLLGGQVQTLNCTNVGDVTVADLDGDDADVVIPPPGI